MLATVLEEPRTADTDTRPTSGQLRIVRTSSVTPRMLRLTAAVEAAHLPFDASCPNQVIRLTPPALAAVASDISGTRTQSRTYTIRGYDDSSGQLDIDVVLHGDGPFVQWARAAAPGDTITFTGPRPHAVPSFDADALVLLSDETGLPAVGALLEAAPPRMPVQAVIEVADAAEEQPLSTQAELALTWLHRNGAAPGTTGALEQAARSLDWPGGRVEVWIAGETSAVRATRRFAATERGVARGDVHAYGYWRRGRSGSA